LTAAKAANENGGMNFPETRPTLIQRIVSDGDDADWRQFLTDYWGPVCRFAARRSLRGSADVEDIASQTFEALLTNRLLARWILNRSAKLRTLLCTVARNVMSNCARVEQGRARLLRERLEQGGELIGLDAPVEQVDAFYAAWVEDLVDRSVELLLDECHRAGKGDYFRVLHGRLCEEMAMADVADSLGLKVATVENYFKAARKRLAAILQDVLRQQLKRYADGQRSDEELQAEWHSLGEHLTAHGGLEGAVRRAYGDDASMLRRERKTEQINRTLSRIKSSRIKSEEPG
jgi:RNA polymerase sigma factor (sigma-70 family)